MTVTNFKGFVCAGTRTDEVGELVRRGEGHQRLLRFMADLAEPILPKDVTAVLLSIQASKNFFLVFYCLESDFIQAQNLDNFIIDIIEFKITNFCFC